MKPIVKPIKKGTNATKISALGSIILTGAIAVSAAGCTVDIKSADGTPLGSVVVNGDQAEAIVNGINVNPANADTVNEPTEVTLPDDNFETEPTETEEDKLPATTGYTGENDNDDGAANKLTPTTVPVYYGENDAGPDATYPDMGTAIQDLKEGTVLKFKEEGGSGRFSLNDKGINLTFSAAKGMIEVVSTHNGKKVYSYGNIKNDNLGVCSAVLFKKNGEAYMYVSAMHGGDICEINIYKITDTSFDFLGYYDFLFLGDMKTPDRFSCYEHHGRNYFFFLHRDYKVGANGMPEPYDNNCTITNTYDAKLKFDTSGWVIENGKVTDKQRVIKKGELFDLVKTDLENYIDVRSKSGTEYRIYCKSAFTPEKEKANGIFCLFENTYEHVESKADVTALKDGTVYSFDIYETCQELDCAGGKYKFYPNATNEHIDIEYNGVTFTLPVKHDNLGVRLGASWLLKTNGKAYLYITSSLMGDNCAINVYEVTDNSVNYVGSHEGLRVYGKLNDPAKFYCHEYDGMNGIVSIQRNYKVSANGMPVIADYMCYVEVPSGVKPKASKDITGYVVKDGKATSEKFTIKMDDYIKPIEFNEVSYIDIKDEASGKIIRVDFEPLLNEFYDQKNNNWVYKAVLSLIKL